VFSLINDWFDLLNTQFPVDKFTKSYGMDLDSQNSVLDQMDYFITNMKVYGSKRRLPFQTGNLINYSFKFNLNNQTNYLSRHTSNQCIAKKSSIRFKDGIQ